MGNFNNSFGGYGTYAFPNYTRNFNEQYGQTPYNNQMQAPTQGVQPSGNFYYVNGIEGAKAFLVPANSSAVLFDSDSNSFFVKSANSQGQAVLKKFDYNEAQPMQMGQNEMKPIDTTKYVTKEEFNELKVKINSLIRPKEVKKDV